MTEKVTSKRKSRHGDRRDGYLIKGVDPIFVLIPHIMKTRNDAMVFFEERVEITELEKFVRRMRRETDMKDLSTMQVIMAAAVRMIALHPGVNRFVAGKRIYARNHISLSIALKKEMNLAGEETTITPKFSPSDNLHDVWEKLHQEFAANKGSEAENNTTDDAAKVFGFFPNSLLGAIVNFVKFMDNHRMGTKFLNEVSPFHTSCFMVDNGSIGLGPVYHHLYNFGTCSIFVSIGRKENTLKKMDDGSIQEVKSLNIKIVVDERICDGYYFALTIRDFRKLLKHPEQLLERPENLTEDPELPPLKEEKKRQKAELKLAKKQAKASRKSKSKEAA